MLKRLISCLIVFSMLWSDIAAAMNDDQEVKSSSRPSSLVIKGVNLTSKNGTTEGSPLLKGAHPDPYRTITPMTEIASPYHSINGTKDLGFPSDEEEHKRASTLSDHQDAIGDRKVEKGRCPSCWPCKKKKEGEVFIIYSSSDSEDEKSVDSRLLGEEEKKCCSGVSWPSCCKKKVVGEDLEEEDLEASPKTCCWPFSCCKKKGMEEDVEASPKRCCWPFSCCGKKSSGAHPRENDPLLIIEQDPSLRELKKQLLLRLQTTEEFLSGELGLEEQDEQEVLAQKLRFIYSKIKGISEASCCSCWTSSCCKKKIKEDVESLSSALEDFGRWFQGHVVENRWRWQDWGGLFIALCMAAGTGSAMSDIVEYSIYNSFFAHHSKQYMPIVKPLARYINVSTALTAFVDATTFMPEATSPSTGSFTMAKSPKEKRYDRSLIPLAAISGIYLLLLHFIVTQDQKKFNGETGWWNSPDQVLYFSALGFFPYLVAQTWKGMRTAVSKVFHPTVPGHVKERVLALRTLEARLNFLPDEDIDALYHLLKDPLYSPQLGCCQALGGKSKAWARYFFKGDIADEAKVNGLLTYVTLTKYAKEYFNEEVEPEEGGPNTRKAARILAALGLPAGFSLVAISVYGLLSAFMGWQGALALSITAAALGFIPESFLQSHNVQETLDDMSAKELGPKRGWKQNVKDPWWWGAGAAKVLGLVWSAFQNLLTNLAPIFVSLAMLVPEQLGGSATVQTVTTSLMIAVAIPYLISEFFSGTHDMWGHLVSIAFTVHDFCYGIYDRIMACCGKEVTLSPRRQKREIRRILKEAIRKTLTFTPKFVEDLDEFERKLNGTETFL